MRHEFKSKMPEVADTINFYIGDGRNLASVKNAMHGVDYIFHGAALKQIESCEFFPIKAGIESVVYLFTDKATYPVNAMSTSKMMEKVIVAKARTSSNTKICCTRYGNVMCSRSSVISFRIDPIRNGKPITLTEHTMIRFTMSIDLVFFAFEHGESGVIFSFRKLPLALFKLRQKPFSSCSAERKSDIKVITFVMARRCMRICSLIKNVLIIDVGNFYQASCDKRGLNYDKYFNKGDTERNPLTEFNSNNT